MRKSFTKEDIILEVKFHIPDDKIENYTSKAKDELSKVAEKHTLDVIREADKVDELWRESGVSQQITPNHVIQASRRTTISKKKGVLIVVLKIIAELLLFFAGLLFLPEKFAQANGEFNLNYFLLFIGVLTIALIMTICMHFKGGD